ncbi:MAG: sigma-70 family RNA polymerase sigma factor [Acidimicrobiales bacterium]|nr:sigma-70 family RNA polymerase sigma factor [Acidimicrobiales bacterium]MCB9394344.1 sigma-70 family RNA polymerase sigma factor [Acidimicrobiaceae bacterium]
MDVDELFVRCRADLVRFATALVGPDDALDLVSDVVTSTLAGGRLDRIHDVRAYWFRSVANRSMSWHRSAQRRRRRDTRQALDRTEGREEMSALEGRELLQQLSGQQRVMVYLTYWHDWDPATIAATLDVGEGTVRKQLARARARLREVMPHE